MHRAPHAEWKTAFHWAAKHQLIPLHHAVKGHGQAEFLSRKLLGGCCGQQQTGTQGPASFPSFTKLMLCSTFSWKSTFQSLESFGLSNYFSFFLFNSFHSIFMVFFLHKPLVTLFVEKAWLQNKPLAVPEPGREFSPMWQHGLRGNGRVGEPCLSKPEPVV